MVSLSGVAFQMILTISLLSLSACSKSSDEKDESKNEEARPERSEEKSACEAGKSGENCDQLSAALVAGLPDFCSTSEYDNKSCIKCTPREIPILRCGVAIAPDFSGANHCNYNNSFVQCLEPDFGVEVKFEYSKKSLKEIYYENLPQVIGGIKFVVGATIKNEGENDRILLFGLFDKIVLHRKSLFTGQDSEQVLADILSLFTEKNPNITATQRAMTEEHIKKSMDIIASNLDQDIITADDLIEFLKAVIAAIKIGDNDALTSQVNIEKIEATFRSPQTRAMIEELLKGLAQQ